MSASRKQMSAAESRRVLDLHPRGIFDFFGNLDRKKRLVRLAYEALPPGGAFIAVENIIDDARRWRTRSA
jgi:hypothetical protein